MKTKLCGKLERDMGQDKTIWDRIKQYLKYEILS